MLFVIAECLAIKSTKGAQGRGKILTRYYSMRRKLIKVGLLNVKANTAEPVVTNGKF